MKIVTREDKEEVFRLATGGLVHSHGDQFVDGMSDEELRQALENALGTFGGSAAPDRPSVCHKGAGLKIWGAWDVTDHINDTPLFEGKATLQMARDMYGISDPVTNKWSSFKSYLPRRHSLREFYLNFLKFDDFENVCYIIRT